MSSSSVTQRKTTTSTDPLTQSVTQPTAPATDVAPIRNGVALVASSAVLDWAIILSLVFGGCCSNGWALGKLLKENPQVGSALTFCQLLFIALRSLPSFLTFGRLPGTELRIVPGLKTRVVPLRRWLVDVLILCAVTLLNNRVFTFRIPLTVQIIFRSGGLAVSMAIGYLRLKRRYSFLQVSAVALVTVGVILATLSSKPAPKPALSSEAGINASTYSADAASKYALGIVMLLIGLVLSGMLGMRQETTYKMYGPQWKEGIFYTHILSLPVFGLMMGDIQQGLSTIHASSPSTVSFASTGLAPKIPIAIPSLYFVLLLNVVSQYLCVSGVNRLTTRVSSVAVNLILTARKAVSVIINVLYFGDGWNAGLVVGGGMVVLGTLLYTSASSGKQPADATEKKKT